ncbi:MAG: phage baseplate assembly protein V [Thermoanaerobaculia bacterium]
MEETLTQLSESVEDVKRKFYGVTVGRVINPLDPLTLGRVQVQLPMIDDIELSPWARVAVPMAGITHGFYFIPNPGDQVLVAFENGELSAPYILGSLWSAMAPPPLPLPVPQIRAIRTLAGNQLVFSEVPPTVTLQSGPTPPVTIPAPPTPAGPPTVILSPAGIQILFGLNIINLTPDGITITGTPNLNLVATAAITLTAPTITLNGAAATNVQSAGVCSVTAPLVKIN